MMTSSEELFDDLDLDIRTLRKRMMMSCTSRGLVREAMFDISDEFRCSS